MKGSDVLTGALNISNPQTEEAPPEPKRLNIEELRSGHYLAEHQPGNERHAVSKKDLLDHVGEYFGVETKVKPKASPKKHEPKKPEKPPLKAPKQKEFAPVPEDEKNEIPGMPIDEGGEPLSKG